MTVRDPFAGMPLAAEGVNVCVNGEDVQVFAYSSQEERVVAARRISPTDPTHVGNAIVEWQGSPKFWGRDRILVLYFGRTDAISALLVSVLGQPFAQGFAGAVPLREEC